MVYITLEPHFNTSNVNVHLLGVTATPDRGDNFNTSNVNVHPDRAVSAITGIPNFNTSNVNVHHIKPEPFHRSRQGFQYI